MKGKLKIIVESIIDVEYPKEDVWPGCKTIEDVKNFQQKMIDNGDYNEYDLLGNDVTLKVEIYELN